MIIQVKIKFQRLTITAYLHTSLCQNQLQSILDDFRAYRENPTPMVYLFKRITALHDYCIGERSISCMLSHNGFDIQSS